MLKSLRERFARGPLVLDGATGTELSRRGVDTALPLWSAAALISHPEIVQAVHEDYVRAGADIVVANTFRSNPRTLARAGMLDRGPQLNRLAVELVRRAADTAGRPIVVAASVAPVEDCYRPDLVPSEAELRAEHALMARWLAEAGADLLWIETMNTAREARCAAAAAADRGLPFAVSFVPREDGALLGGDGLADAVAQVEPLGPVALGVNCIPPEGIGAALAAMRQLTQRPLAVYAHLGNPQPITGWTFSSSISPRDYAQQARGWFECGANVVGGCCGTTPEHIRAVRGAANGLARGAPG